MQLATVEVTFKIDNLQFLQKVEQSTAKLKNEIRILQNKTSLTKHCTIIIKWFKKIILELKVEYSFFVLIYFLCD